MYALLIVFAILAQQRQLTVETREEAGILWEYVTFHARSSASGPMVTVKASTAPRRGVPYLKEIQLSVGGHALQCPQSFFKDLDLPKLGTISLWYDSATLEVHGDFWLRFEYGFPKQDARFVQVRIRVHGGRCVDREFRVPEEGGNWRYQDTKP